MDSFEEEIQSQIISGNFSRASQLSKEWLESFSIEQSKSYDFKLAEEAFNLARFFHHRQERLGKFEVGSDRSRTFIQILGDLEKERKNGNYNAESAIWRTVKYYIHSQIAEGLAKDLAGQKSFNLKHEDIIQLSVSLIETENWKSAFDTL